MADNLRLSGSVRIAPTSGAPSGDPDVGSPIDESMVIEHPITDKVELLTDDPVEVSLGSADDVNFIQLRAVGGKVRARLTSADGTSQSVPVDPYFLVISKSVAFTAIDLTREAGVLGVAVKVLLGQQTA